MIVQVHRGSDFFCHNEAQGHGLTGTGLRRDAQVAAGKVGIEDFCLDRGQFGEAAIGEDWAKACGNIRKGRFIH